MIEQIIGSIRLVWHDVSKTADTLLDTLTAEQQGFLML